MKKSELRKLIREEIVKSPLNRKFGEPLPTLKDMATYKSKLKEEVKTAVTVQYSSDEGKGTFEFDTFETNKADIKKTAQSLLKNFKIVSITTKPIKK